MDLDSKKQLNDKIGDYMIRKSLSQNKLAKEIGISPAHMSNIRNEENWHLVSDIAWKKVRNFFKPASGDKWNILTLNNFNLIQELCEDAQVNSRCLAVTGETGYGKTTALENFAKNKPNTTYVLCNFLMTKKTFLKAIAKAMKVDVVFNTEALLFNVVEFLNSEDSHLLILDDVGKLNDSCYRLIQLIYDATEGRAGMILGGTNYLKKHMTNMIEKDKMGFRELHRRIGYWLELQPADYSEIQSICEHNGVRGFKETKYIYRMCKNFGSLKEMIINAKRLAGGEDVTIDILSNVKVN